MDIDQYIPILRWKQAEWMALRKLDIAIRKHVTPLVELSPPKFISFFEKKILPLNDELNKQLSN